MMSRIWQVSEIPSLLQSWHSHTPDLGERQQPALGQRAGTCPDWKHQRSCGTRGENRHIREVPVCCRFKETGNNRIIFSLGTWLSHSPCQFFIDDFRRNRKMVHSNCFSAGGRFLYCLCHMIRCWCPRPSVKALVISGPLWAPLSLSAGPGRGHSQAVGQPWKRRRKWTGTDQ